jgi:hypothetical protein
VCAVVFDVYVNRNGSKVSLVDFNPFATFTDGLLFEWDEIIAGEELLFEYSFHDISHSFQVNHLGYGL